METAYATAAVCDFRNSSKCDLRLDPGNRRFLSMIYRLYEHEVS